MKELIQSRSWDDPMEVSRLADAGSRLSEVALLIQGDDNYGVGRVARETTALLPGLRCVAFCRGSEYDDIVAGGTPVHLLSGGEYFRGFAPRRGAAGAVWQLLRARPHWRRCAEALHQWCQREQVRVLHGNVWAHYFTLGALRQKYPGLYRTVWHTHNFLNIDRNLGLRGRFNAWQVRRGADWLLCVSSAVSKGWGRSGVPVRVVHNCVASRYLDLPAAPRFSSRAASGRPLRLVGAGRMEWSKGHHVTIDAVARLHASGVAVTLDLFGGPIAGNAYHESLRAQVKQLHLEPVVTFHDYANDFVQRIADFDIAIQSRIDPEPCSLYVLECMSRAVPLVASAGGGTPELMRDAQEGRLYTPGDAAALARCVESMARDPHGTDRLAQAARDRVHRDFSPDEFARKTMAFYGEVLAGPAGTWETADAVAADDAATFEHSRAG